jgi:hypothetical protein
MRRPISEYQREAIRRANTTHGRWTRQAPCECGCGELANKGRRFIKGHNARGNRWQANAPSGEEHYRWAETPSYQAAHKRIRRIKDRTGICDRCGQRTEPTNNGHVGTEFHSKTRDFTMNPADWEELCHRCHVAIDGRWTK